LYLCVTFLGHRVQLTLTLTSCCYCVELTRSVINWSVKYWTARNEHSGTFTDPLSVSLCFCLSLSVCLWATTVLTQLATALSLSLTLRFNGHFPGEPGLAVFTEAKDDEGKGYCTDARCIYLCVCMCIAWLCQHNRSRHQESLSHVKAQQSTEWTS